MKKFGKLVTLALSFGMLAAFLGMFTSKPVAAQLPPLPIIPVDIDGPARNRFQASCRATFSDSGSGACGIATVPEDKLLVIETVTVKVEVATGKPIETIELAVTQDTETTLHYLAVIRIGSRPSRDIYMITAPVRLYADGGTTVRVSTLTDATGNQGTLFASISGHLVTP